MLATTHHIILASGSPRRKQFLEALQLPFTVKIPQCEEIYPEHLQGTAITDYIAALKAQEFLPSLADNELLISCDTLVWHNGKALGKPTNEVEAFEMLQSLSGQTHQVISSVCMATQQQQIVFNATTDVRFSEISEADIRFYIKNYHPLDKAGAYGIQDWIGLTYIAEVQGSYTNVVGMPMELLYQHLKNWGVILF